MGGLSRTVRYARWIYRIRRSCQDGNKFPAEDNITLRQIQMYRQNPEINFHVVWLIPVGSASFCQIWSRIQGVGCGSGACSVSSSISISTKSRASKLCRITTVHSGYEMISYFFPSRLVSGPSKPDFSGEMNGRLLEERTEKVGTPK